MKVEQQDQFKELAEKFTKKTGIQVDIATASSDTYEQSLKSELPNPRRLRCSMSTTTTF